MLDPKESINHIISPTSYDEFFSHILSKKILIQKGDGAKARVAIGGDDPKTALLAGYAKYAPDLTCHSHAPNSPPPKARHVENEDEFLALIKQYHELGYTVRFPDVTELSSPLSDFTRALEKQIGNPVGVVVFWSAPTNAAPVHYDEVDVIVIQLVGTKQWYISNTPTTFPNKWKNTAEGAPPFNDYQTVDVAPGDFIYLPRGTAHTVKSTSESIHLSIGFVPVTVREGMNAVLDHLSDLDIGLRQNIGQRADDIINDDKHATINQQIRQGLEKLLAQSQSDAFIEDALKRRQAHMIAALPKLKPTILTSALQANTIIEHSPHAMVEMIATVDTVDFSQPGEHILVHKGAQESLTFIINTPRFIVSDIPGELGLDVQLALVSRLLSSGFLQLAD